MKLSINLLSPVILVGFEQIFTRVDEEIGSFEICIKIFTSTSHLPVDFGFSLNLITMPGTAGMYMQNQ